MLIDDVVMVIILLSRNDNDRVMAMIVCHPHRGMIPQKMPMATERALIYAGSPGLRSSFLIKAFRFANVKSLIAAFG